MNVAEEQTIIDVDTTDEFLDAEEIEYEDGTTLSERAANAERGGAWMQSSPHGAMVFLTPIKPPD
jgi:hypothetical protein